MRAAAKQPAPKQQPAGKQQQQPAGKQQPAAAAAKGKGKGKGKESESESEEDDDDDDDGIANPNRQGGGAEGTTEMSRRQKYSPRPVNFCCCGNA